MLLKVKDLSAVFHTPYGKVQAVDGVSFELHQGQIFGLIGETGSGKSVLGLSIPGLLPADAEVTGSIRYKEQELLPLHKKTIRKLRGKEIALIPQNPATALNPVMTIGKQIVESVRLHRKPAGRSEAEKQAVRLLADLSMPEPERKLNSYPFQFSGGMKQRVLAAVGIAGRPSLLIADEPTKGLDALVRNQVVELLRRVARLTGAGLLVITHDLHVAQSLCDTIGVMYAGQIVEQGPAKQLLSAPLHPYTKGLLGSLPGRGMVPVPGASPGPGEQLPGCKFAARCKIGLPECGSTGPDLYTAALSESGAPNETRSKVRCLLYDPGRQPEQTVFRRVAEQTEVSCG